VRRNLLVAFAAVAMLAACSTSSPSLTGAAFGSRNASPLSGSAGELLYVTDWYDGKIFIFAYPGGTPMGTIADAQYPLGLCSDIGGNVWVTNFGAASNQIVEYAHGGTTPIATLNDPGEDPRSCSIDPTTGNLAVANSEPGDVVVYTRGTPQPYDPQLNYPIAVAYDDKGNLFVDGYHIQSGPLFRLSVLPAGAAQFQHLKVESALGVPGSLQWDGTDLAVGDSEHPNTIYRLKVANKFKHAVLDSTVTLNGPVKQSAEGVQFWMGGGTLIMPFGAQHYVNNVGFWNYPAGGDYVSRLKGLGPAELSGVTVSVSPTPSPSPTPT
jgi:hypothetical protein